MPPTKWYVNLLEGNPANNTFARGRAHNHGPWIKLKATRKLGHGWKSSTKRKVDWELTWKPGEHADYMPDAKLPYLRSDDADGQVGKAKDKSTLRVKEANDKSFNAHAVVPPFGGLEYKVKANKHSGADNVDLDQSYTAWRRLYYTVNYLNDRCKALFEAVESDWKAAYEAAFIDLKLRGKRVAAGDDETESLQTFANPTMTNKHAGALDRSPFHLRILLVNDVVSSQDKTFTFSVTRNTNTNDLEYAQDTITVTTNIEANLVVERGFELSTLELTPKAAAVDVPSDAITRLDDHRLSIDMTHEDLADAWKAIKATRLGNLDVMGTATRQAPTLRTVSAEVKAEHTEQQPLTVGGHTKLWIKGQSIYAENIAQGFSLCHSDGRDMGNVGVKTHSISVEGDSPWFRPSTVDNKPNQLSFYTSDRTVSDKLKQGKSAQVDLQLKLRPTALQATSDQTFDIRGFGQSFGKDGTLWFEKSADTLVAKDTDAIFAATPIKNVKVQWDAAALDLSAHVGDKNLVEFSQDISELKIKLGHNEAAAAKQAIDAGREVKVEAKAVWRSSIGGYYTKGTNVIVLTCIKLASDEPVRTTRKRLLQVALHELGHALGLVLKSETGSDGQARNNDRQYTGEYGGQGEHCNHNAHLENSHRTSSGQLYVPDDQATPCTMFHTVKYLDQMDGKFCDRCLAQLTRAEVKLPK